MSKDPEEEEGGEEDFDDLDLDDSDLLELADAVDLAANTNQHSSSQPAAPYSPAAIDVDTDEYPFPELDHGSDDAELDNLFSDPSPPPADHHLLEDEQRTFNLAAPTTTLAHYTRTFPTPVPARTPITGLSTRVLVKTVFRLSQLPPAGDELVELYARVASSTRGCGGGRQRFGLVDLFAEGAGELVGVYEGLGRCGLWDADARVFLDAGAARIARVVGRVRGGGDAVGMAVGVRAGEVYLHVLVIWEVDMGEVATVRALLG